MNEKNKVFHTCSFMDPELDKSDFKIYEFLESFDPIQLKYSPDGYWNEKNRVPSDLRDEMIKYDSTYSMEALNKEPYNSISDNIDLVYGSSRVVENDLKVFHLTEKKIIYRYLAIPQLTKMFDEDYFQFEWDMHVTQNFREHRNNYQRDHFIHQIRDMYSMMILLGNHGFYDACKEILGDRNISKISLYTQMKLSEFMNSQKGINSRFEKIKEAIYYYFGDSLNSDNDLNSAITAEKKIDICLEKYKETYFIKYVIYASSILAALFHDMGYPICHFLETRNRASKYNPTMYMFIRNEVESFDHIASLLSSSLLFTVVSREEIRASLQMKSKGGYNHGAYSAISFLMQFYNSGIIFSLPKEKQCAIEMAALAIYNHTMDYRVSKDDSKSYYYQPVFKQNPISFLLRLCDDLQEWNRRYFVVSEESDIPICSKCLSPSIFCRTNDKITYHCLCSSCLSQDNVHSDLAKVDDYNSFRYYNFYNRKLYLVSTSDYMTSYDITKYKSEKNKIRALCFHIHYDYYRLLNVTRINPTYAKYRISELNDLKKLLRGQDFKKHLQYDYIYLDYFITPNPITIKIKILEEFAKIKNIKIEDITIDNTVDDVKNSDSLKKLLKMVVLSNNENNNTLFDFYKDLLIQLQKLKKIENQKDFQETVNKFIKKWVLNNTFDYYKNIMESLIIETFEQYLKECTPEESLECFDKDDFQERYLNQYAPQNKCDSDGLYNIIIAYCNSENIFNRYSDNITVDNEYKYQCKYISYFADLYYFEAMNRVIQKAHIDEFKKSKQTFQANDASKSGK